MSQLVALSSGLSLYAKEWGSSMAPVSSFVPREAVPPLSNALQEGRLSLTVWSRGSQSMLFTPRPLPLSSIEHLYASQAPPWQWHRLLKLQTWSFTAYKNYDNQPLSFSTWMVLGKCFSCAMPYALLSLSSLHDQDPSPPQNLWFFSPTNHVSAPPTFYSVVSFW